MSKQLRNLLKNGRLVTRAGRLRGWISESPDGITSTQQSAPSPDAEGDLYLEAARRGSEVSIHQAVQARPKKWYRLDALARPADPAVSNGRGLCLEVKDGQGGSTRADPATSINGVSDGGWTPWRQLVRPPDGEGRLEVRLGLTGPKTSAWVRTVRLVAVEKPETEDHALALPPRWAEYAAPRRVKRAAVCAGTYERSGLSSVLRRRLGNRGAASCGVSDVAGDGPRCDALFVTGLDTRGGRIGWRRLVALARTRLLVVGLPSFAAALRCDGIKVAAVREHRQEGELLYGRVMEGNFITRGYALRDVAPFGWPVPGTFEMVQRSIARTAELNRFLARERLVPILTNETKADASSRQYLALYKETRGGGLLVMDTDMFEAGPTHRADVSLPLTLLSNLLGGEGPRLGQFMAPPSDAARMRSQTKEFCERFLPTQLIEDERPASKDASRCIEIGPPVFARGLPNVGPPRVIIRTGWRDTDFGGYAGTLQWLKRLLRKTPTDCKYRDALFDKVLLVWAPAVPADVRTGRNTTVGTWPSGGQNDVILDVVPAARHAVTLTAGATDTLTRALARTFGAACASLLAGRHFGLYPAPGAPSATQLDIRFDEPTIEVRVDRSGFAPSSNRPGPRRFRLEVPGDIDVSGTDSIARTDLVATVLEQIMLTIADVKA